MNAYAHFLNTCYLKTHRHAVYPCLKKALTSKRCNFSKVLQSHSNPGWSQPPSPTRPDPIFRHRVWLDEEVTGRNKVTTTFLYDWPLWCACSFSGCEWGLLSWHPPVWILYAQVRSPWEEMAKTEPRNKMLYSPGFRPVTWSSSHLGHRNLTPFLTRFSGLEKGVITKGVFYWRNL